MPEYLEYDESSIVNPAGVVDRLIKAKTDDYHSLVTSECFDLEAGEAPQFEQALAALHGDFDRVVASLTKALGVPAFAGKHKDPKFPKWAGTGYRVAYWRKGKQIVYVHITHVGTVAPLQLNLGVVTGPPKAWAVGC